MDIKITDNVKALQRGLGKVEKKQIPMALAATLTTLAFKSMEEEKRQAPRLLDRPTPHSIRGFKFKKATKKTLTSLVYVNDGDTSRKYMQFAIHGGVSRANRGALIHPTANTKLNKYGNITRNYAKKVLAKPKFFSGVPNGIGGQENAGIWQRYGGKKNPRIRMVAQWRKSRTYQAKFPFYEIAGKIVAGRANDTFNKAFARAMRTAR